MRRSILFVIILLLSMTSCSYKYLVPLQPQYESMFLGKSHNYIVSTWGAPDRTTSDGEEGQILIYERTSMLSQAVATNINVWTGTYTPGLYTTSNTLYVHLFVDKQGQCYRVMSNHAEQHIDTRKNTQSTLIIIGLVTAPILAMILMEASKGN